jgi:hypothetical protein|tara:strand:- start:83 stop:292 length:210 start_codon:yes stop_codon:yes gene_type:complete
LIKVFKERDKPDEVGVLEQLLLHQIKRYFHILEVIPFEEPGLLLSQGFLNYTGSGVLTCHMCAGPTRLS